MQLAALVLRIVHGAHPGAQLEAERRVVPQGARDAQQVFALDVEGEFAPVDHGAVDGVPREQALLVEGAFEFVGDLVEDAVPLTGGRAAVGPAGRSRERDGADEAAVPAGVAGVLGAEHSPADADDVAALAAGGRERGLLARLLGVLVGVAHRSSPFISMVGSALRAASSASRAASSLLTPSLELCTFWWSLTIASTSISGRGGQPGR
ncbi:hypothetical protein EES44_03800 [Streptomyces sp. ADI96-15]|nr:hypothetical protein EES44_03800 [Streptomyces sp. ADI96-15]